MLLTSFLPRWHRLLPLVAVLVAACGPAPPALITVPPPPDWTAPSVEDITLGVGDVLEVGFFKSYDSEGPYRLETGDRIQVVVDTRRMEGPYRLGVGDRVEVAVKTGEVHGPYRILPDGACTLPLLGAVQLAGLTVDEARDMLTRLYRRHYEKPRVDLLVTESASAELDQVVTILPDGNCTLPLLGAIELRAKTAEEAAAILTREYSQHFQDPDVDVLVLESGERTADFLSLMLQSSRGTTRQLTVQADGVLDLPLIAPIHLLNRTLGEVREEIQTAYAEVLPEVRLSVNLSSASLRKIAVFGEVERGGVFDSPRPVSPLVAIAMAGGFTVSAHRSQVLLVHPEKDGSLEVWTLDLKGALEMEEPGAWGLTVGPNDVLYVPRSKIANVNLFVEQYIRNLIPLQFGIGVGVEYQLN